VEENQLHEELSSIRNMMERSSKFLSLSGLSGILAGVYALIGAALAYRLVYSDSSFFGYRDYLIVNTHSNTNVLYQLIMIAVVVLIASLLTGVLLTARKARKQGQVVWGKASKTLVYQMAVPLVTGGLLMLIFIGRGYLGVVAPASLIFYGLALISASNFTYSDVRYLGFCEIALGLLAAVLPGYGLIFWALGFGILHIVYGSIMYLKYDR
jgi:formate/nitrite transporter FocA (FNT family)